MRNPKWHRDEIILALELYFRTEPGQISKSNPEIIELSEILNKLPIHDVKPDEAKFRNPNGVTLKLSNLLAIDPNYEGKGMTSFSKLDEKVFYEFCDNRQELVRLANQIKKTVNNTELNLKLYYVPEEEGETEGVREGRVIYKLHKYRERNSKLTSKKKATYLKKNGKLDCEICKFDFQEFYGELGKGYIECHHKVPLSDIDSETETKQEDLALVCSNCHRMLHRQINTLKVEELKDKGLKD